MKMDKKLLASRGLRPADPQQGLCSWTPLVAPTPDPRYKLELRARDGSPPSPWQILDPSLSETKTAISSLELTSRGFFSIFVTF